MPRRSAPAAVTIVSTPTRSFGGWDHRVTASYGTEPQEMHGPPTVRRVPDGPTAGHSGAVPVLAQTWSVVYPSLPSVLPRPRYVKPPHGGFVPAIRYPFAATKPAMRVRTGAGDARVTTQPKARIIWKRQGK